MCRRGIGSLDPKYGPTPAVARRPRAREGFVNPEHLEHAQKQQATEKPSASPAVAVQAATSPRTM